MATYNAGAKSLFENFGVFVKSGGTGTTVLDGGVVFNNLGVVSLQSGILSLKGSYSLASGNLNFGISSATNFGVLNLGGSAPWRALPRLPSTMAMCPCRGLSLPS